MGGGSQQNLVPRPNAQILFKCLLAEGARSQISANPAALSGVVHVKLGQLPPSPSAALCQTGAVPRKICTYAVGDTEISSWLQGACLYRCLAVL